jgi:glutathione S-transferase
MKHKKPKLIYFPIRGRGEHIRQALKLAGVHFEDVHVSFDLWPQFKGEMPLGHVPVLEVDGVKIADSKAIARFVGQEYGVYLWFLSGWEIWRQDFLEITFK